MKPDWTNILIAIIVILLIALCASCAYYHIAIDNKNFVFKQEVLL